MWYIFSKCPCHDEDITLGNYRGEDLEVVEGGMQDYSYLFTNCMELTVEVCCDKKPPSRTLATHWRQNYPALLATLTAVDGGVKGLVLDHRGEPLAGATVRIAGIDKDTVTTERGEFWRLLLPGTYSISALYVSGSTVLTSKAENVIVTRDLGHGSIIINLMINITPNSTNHRFGQSG